MKFKLKILKNANDPNDYYWKIVTLDEILYQGIGIESHLIVGIYRLITKIDDLEVYEYDCWYYVKPHGAKILFYGVYDSNGELIIECFNINFNNLTFKNFYYNYEDSLFDTIYSNIDKIKFIGNFHDGEDYLLNKIKEFKYG